MTIRQENKKFIGDSLSSPQAGEHFGHCRGNAHSCSILGYRQCSCNKQNKFFASRWHTIFDHSLILFTRLFASSIPRRLLLMFVDTSRRYSSILGCEPKSASTNVSCQVRRRFVTDSSFVGQASMSRSQPCIFFTFQGTALLLTQSTMQIF